MYTIDITAFANTDNSNRGICKEWGLCRYYGIDRKVHDHSNYMEASDIELDNGMDISVKSPKATLMSGRFCTDCATKEEIIAKYCATCHSNTVAFVTHEWIAYIMTVAEFVEFVRQFGYLKQDSKKNGGYTKIAFYEESKRMRNWLAACVA